MSNMHAFQEINKTLVLNTISFILVVARVSETIENFVAQQKIFNKSYSSLN